MFKSIKKAIGQIWSPVGIILDITEDTTSTYGNEVLIANAETRAEQLTALKSLGKVTTNAQIADILAGKTMSDEEAKEAVA